VVLRIFRSTVLLVVLIGMVGMIIISSICICFIVNIIVFMDSHVFLFRSNVGFLLKWNQSTEVKLLSLYNV
jgi:hypothetical protein